LFLHGGIAQPHHTTAFIGKRGNLDVLGSITTYSTDSFWNVDGDRLPTFNHFSEKAYMLYAEYAVNACNSLTFNGGYARVRESMNGSSNSCTDPEIGWKHLLYRERNSALTGYVIGILPVNDLDRAVRYGKGGVELSLLYSKIYPVRNFTFWYDFAFGYRWYQGFPSDQIRSMLTLGLNLNRCAWIMVTNELEYGLYNGDPQGNINNITLNSNYRLYRLKEEIVIRVVKHTFITLGAYQHLWGRSVGTGGGFYGGLWLVF
jgi:hypothetical protein